MTMMISSMNLWAVLVCIVINMVLGALWYSPLLFGNIWLKLVDKTAEDISPADAGKSMSLSLIAAALSIIFLALILSFVNSQTWLDALVIGSLMSAGFIGMGSLNLVLFEGRSFKLSVLNVGYSFVAFNIGAQILTYWK